MAEEEEYLDSIKFACLEDCTGGNSLDIQTLLARTDFYSQALHVAFSLLPIFESLIFLSGQVTMHYSVSFSVFV